MSLPAILKSTGLAKILGVDHSTLWRWLQTDATLRGCVLRQTRRSTWWSTQRLQERGYLTRETQPNAALPMQIASAPRPMEIVS